VQSTGISGPVEQLGFSGCFAAKFIETMNKRSLMLILGFFLFVSSILDFILNLVGLSLYGYDLIDRQGFLVGLVFKLLCLTAGLTMVYFVQNVRK